MTPELPDRYGRTELVLMVVDPSLLFAYWEVTSEGLREAQVALGAEMKGARAVLRFYDISLIHFDGTNAHHTFDIDIGLEGRNWYVHLWTAEKSYCADLGFVARTGPLCPESLCAPTHPNRCVSSVWSSPPPSLLSATPTPSPPWRRPGCPRRPPPPPPPPCGP